MRCDFHENVKPRTAMHLSRKELWQTANLVCALEISVHLEKIVCFLPATIEFEQAMNFSRVSMSSWRVEVLHWAPPQLFKVFSVTDKQFAALQASCSVSFYTAAEKQSSAEDIYVQALGFCMSSFVFSRNTKSACTTSIEVCRNCIFKLWEFLDGDCKHQAGKISIFCLRTFGVFIRIKR